MCEFVQRMKNEGISEGLLQGRTEGLLQGRREGIVLERDNIFSLFSRLYAAGRNSDVERATKDRDFLNALLSEQNPQNDA